ncbi:hypothetical protein TruAng_002026 [Truncatella angustata]|nr:hypothetical protein TruAng_002026 [Truncatella angustata]
MRNRVGVGGKSSGVFLLPVFWALFALHCRPSHSAYVQVKQCDHFSGPSTWHSGSLRASLHPGKSHTDISLEVFDPTNFEDCETNSTTADITLLGHSTRAYSPTVDGPCATSQYIEGNHSFNTFKPALYLSQRVDNFYPLSTFEIEITLRAANQTDAGCLSAYITPEIPIRVRDALFYGPLVILIVVLGMNYCQVLLKERDELGANSQLRQTDHKPLAVNGIGFCLQHLQFVFLSACLSLSYPGFFQPAVRSLNWFSLFSSSNAFLGGYTYAGIADGLYETNGTYGGTYGMEHMIQILGAPMTIEIWINMTILVLLVLAVAAIFVWLHRLLYCWLHPPSEIQPSTTLQQLIVDTLRIVLTYFMQPIIAISAYQLDNINLLPEYLVSLAVLLILVVLAAYVWLFKQTSVERIAALYVAIPEAARVQFSVSASRGIVIGAVQVSGSAQIALLMLCEVVSIISVLRFVILALMIPFAVPSASISSRCLSAYVILVLELVILVLAILVPQICSFVNLWRLRAVSEKAPVFGLRQLQRRSYHLRQLPQRPSGGYEDLACVNCGLNPTVRSDNTSTLGLDVGSIHTRPPRNARPSTRTAPSTARPSTVTSRDETHLACDSSLRTPSGTHLAEPEHKGYLADLQSHRSASGGSYVSLPSSESFVLPNADYEVREMDLYYRQPRRPSFRQAANSAGNRLGANLESISNWLKSKW